MARQRLLSVPTPLGSLWRNHRCCMTCCVVLCASDHKKRTFMARQRLLRVFTPLGSL